MPQTKNQAQPATNRRWWWYNIHVGRNLLARNAEGSLDTTGSDCQRVGNRSSRRPKTKRPDNSHLFVLASGHRRKWIQRRYVQNPWKVSETGKIRHSMWIVEIQIADRAEKVIEMLLLLCHCGGCGLGLNSTDEGNSRIAWCDNEMIITTIVEG